MRITTELLIEHWACEDQVDLFAELYPDGVAMYLMGASQHAPMEPLLRDVITEAARRLGADHLTSEQNTALEARAERVFRLDGKISAIKVVREETGISLKEAKRWVDVRCHRWTT